MTNATAELMQEMRTFGIPDHCRPGLAAYITKRRPVGSFLTAVLSNDLAHAVGTADDMNIKALTAYVRFLRNVAPADCHGSPEIVAKWLKGES